jgi:hypothetical protein
MSLGPTLVIVSGLSGAGRTTAMKALEDLGFYCVDNLPVVLLEPFVELFRAGSDRLAVAVDVASGRSPRFGGHARLKRRPPHSSIWGRRRRFAALLERAACPTRGSGSAEDICASASCSCRSRAWRTWSSTGR